MYPGASHALFAGWKMKADKLILIDNGIGNKQDAKAFWVITYLHGDATLDSSLAKHWGGGGGVSPRMTSSTDVTDVFLTHLHFDHVGGAVHASANGDNLVLSF